MEVILDTNFIISCVKKKIDFISELEEFGFKIIVPKEILLELKDLRLKVSHDERTAIDVGTGIIEKANVKKVKIGNGKVDDVLIKYGKDGAYIASLDAYIKRSVPNKVTINAASNKLQIERT
jgi:rRNA-processing protein FCF1